ncbi:MAG: E-cinnamoyl-CoA:R-phenyllactate CoA transferase [Alphaproteobacteria bacterium MarineAlpha9_Bin3]|nr:MAG: E-cinnamoyl-CoA:R-phenyllactate CoA transferase [Alphaproteobacteria bacterium MarineAlpha9_Bin3]
MENLPLKGIKVIDAASFIAAPLVSALMSDYGAEVIKIEPLTGDTYREAVIGGHVWPESDIDWAFILENRNKRSLSIDLKSKEGQAILNKLILEADVFVTNLPKTPRKKLGLTDKVIRKINSRIIYASLSAFGENGPDSDRTGLDSTAYFARSGLMDWSKINELDKIPPFPIPGGGDHPTGLSLFTSILLALMNRDKTGLGTTVTTSLLANGIWSNAMLIQAVLSGHKPIDTFHWDTLSAMRNIYNLKDKSLFFMLLTNEEKHWQPFLRSLNLESLNESSKFNTKNNRQNNKKELKKILQKEFLKYSYDDVRKKLIDTGIVFTKITQTENTISDPQTNLNNMFMNITGESIKDLKIISPPLNIENAPRKNATKAPKLGEHNVEILKELGYTNEEIKILQNKKIVL